MYRADCDNSYAAAHFAVDSSKDNAPCPLVIFLKTASTAHGKAAVTTKYFFFAPIIITTSKLESNSDREKSEE